MAEVSPPAADVRTLTVPDGAAVQRVDRFVADITGLSRSYVAVIESGEHMPQQKTRQKLAVAFGVDVADLLP